MDKSGIVPLRIAELAQRAVTDTILEERRRARGALPHATEPSCRPSRSARCGWP